MISCNFDGQLNTNDSKGAKWQHVFCFTSECCIVVILFFLRVILKILFHGCLLI